MKTTRFIYTLLAVCLAAAAAGDVQAQQTGGPPSEVRANMTVLAVKDRDIPELKKEDIRISENGNEQAITYFEKRGPKLNVGFVLDNTGSLRTRLPQVIDTAKRVVMLLGEKDEAFFVRFVSSDKIGLLHNWSSDKASLGRSLDQMYVEGGQSAVYDALGASADHMLKRAKDSAESFALVLISDCEDRDSKLRENELVEALAKTGIPVFVLALTDELAKESGFTSPSPKRKADDFAKRVAVETGGKAYFPKSKTTDEMLKMLLAEMRSQYIVGYTSKEKKPADKPRKLKVEITGGGKGEGSIREISFVPKN